MQFKWYAISNDMQSNDVQFQMICNQMMCNFKWYAIKWYAISNDMQFQMVCNFKRMRSCSNDTRFLIDVWWWPYFHGKNRNIPFFKPWKKWNARFNEIYFWDLKRRRSNFKMIKKTMFRIIQTFEKKKFKTSEIKTKNKWN